ncbi:MAG: 50S ribosomal protein L6 [Elusimicrobia bacterium]|nr:50S ribosomal protein L6 [Elusimicrobiota bacterium]
MSRIGNSPIPIPNNVKVSIVGNEITITGPAGTLKRNFVPVVSVIVDNNNIIVKRSSDEYKAVHGTTRAIINGMVQGVVTPFEKKLEIQGVGYKAQLAGKKLTLQLGYSHPVEFTIPPEIDIVLDPKGLLITLKSVDKEKLGLIASKIRISKEPDAYKGKGVRYFGEYIKKKPGKAAIGVGATGGAGGAGK